MFVLCKGAGIGARSNGFSQYQTLNSYNMNKQLFTFILLLGSSYYSFTQVTFQKTYSGPIPLDDKGYSVRQTADGGYILTGAANSFGAGEYDVCLIKTDENGDTLWTKTYGGANQDAGNSVEQTTDGGFIVLGWERSFNGDNVENIYLLKTDESGDTLWTKSFGGAGIDYGYSVQQTIDGGYLVAGHTPESGSDDAYLIKTDAEGDTLWTKLYGGAGTERAFSAQQTTDGGYIITGWIKEFGAFDFDTYLIKTNAEGDTLWTKSYGGTGDEWGESVQQAEDGGYIICGQTNSFGLGNKDVYLIKTDDSGILQWSKTFGGAANDDVGLSIQQTTDDGYIITGYTYSFGAGNGDAYLIKTNEIGDSLWTRTFGDLSPDEGHSVRQTSDGGYIIIGRSMSFGSSDFDIYLIKTDEDGNSGCNQGGTATIVTSPPTEVTFTASVVYSAGNIIAPATIVGSGGIPNTLCTNVGLGEWIVNNSLKVFPNPSTGDFIVSLEGTMTNAFVEILNVWGEVVISENLFAGQGKEISLRNTAGGIYFVNVFDGEWNYHTKIIVE